MDGNQILPAEPGGPPPPGTIPSIGSQGIGCDHCHNVQGPDTSRSVKEDGLANMNHLLGPIALTQALLPRMVKAGGGTLVAIASVAGMAGIPLRSAYCAAKHGLIGYHDAVRAENEHLGIKVHVIAPGSVRTDVSRNALTADGSKRGVSDKAIDNGMPPAEVAQAILGAVESGQRELILAKGAEYDIPILRRKDPDALFERMSAMVREGYAKKLAADK
jgi:short-subunit dehydrogenase